MKNTPEKLHLDSNGVPFTPGPWKLAERVSIRLDSAQLIRPVDDCNYEHGAVACVAIGSGNANLIVTAPKLLALLEEAAQPMGLSKVDFENWLNRAQAAIAEAKGIKK